MRRANSADVPLQRIPPSLSLSLPYLSTQHPARSNQCALMSCPIHDRCTCCSTSLQYTSSISTTATSQFAPQPCNTFFGYDYAAPLVAAPGGPWNTVDPVTLLPSSSPYAGQYLPQSDCYRPRNTYETVPLHLMYRREFRANSHEQKPLPSGGQVSVLIVNMLSQT